MMLSREVGRLQGTWKAPGRERIRVSLRSRSIDSLATNTPDLLSSVQG
jgi:hypothetical protein